MPTVRRAQPQVERTALPGVRIGTGTPTGAFGVATAVDLSAPQKLVAGIVEEQHQQADQIKLQDLDNATTALEAKAEQAAQARRGIDALGATDEVRYIWQQGIAELEQQAGHASDRVKSAFRAKANERFTRLHASVETYTAGQMREHDAKSTDAALGNRVDGAAKNPALAPQLAAEARALVTDYGRRQGWDGEQLSAEQTKRVSAVHVAAIESMLTAGNDRAATAYHDAHKGELSGDDGLRVEKALDVASTEGTAMRTVTSIWSTLGPKSVNDPVKVSTMEQAIRDQFPDEPKVVKAAIAELRSRATAFNAEQTELKASNSAAALGAFNNGARLSEIVRMPEYRALDGAEQERIKSHIVDRQYALSEQAKRGDEAKNWGAYWTASEPSTLAKLSENQIRALQPEIGPGLVTQLLERRRAMEKPDNLQSATIDLDQFKDIANSAGLKPYVENSKLKPQEKADLGRLKSFVEAAVSVEEQRRGKPLTRDEKGTIMQRIVDTKVIREGNLFHSDEERIAALVKKSEAGEMTVRFEDVPPRHQQALANLMRANGKPADKRAVAAAYAAMVLDDAARFSALTGER